MVKTPINKFVVDIEKAYMDEVQTKSGITFYRDTTFRPEFFAQTNGTVSGLPRHNDYDVQLGDQIYFSYQVVEDKIQRDRDTDIHKNMVLYKGKKMWVVDTSHIYFRVRDDKIKMLNNYCLLDMIEEEQSSLFIPEHLKKIKVLGKAMIVSGTETKTGEVVFFDQRFVETYELFGKDYYILKEERILGKL